MIKEIRRAKKIAKKILPKNQYKKAKKIKDKKERLESLKYLNVSNLKLKLLELEIRSKNKIKKNSMILESNLNLLKSKIKIFETTHSSKDHKVVEKLIKEIEKELEK